MSDNVIYAVQEILNESKGTIQVVWKYMNLITKIRYWALLNKGLQPILSSMETLPPAFQL